MKKLLLVSLVASPLLLQAELGQFNYNNFAADGGIGFVLKYGSPVVDTDALSIDIFWGPIGTPEENLEPLGSPVQVGLLGPGYYDGGSASIPVSGEPASVLVQYRCVTPGYSGRSAIVTQPLAYVPNVPSDPALPATWDVTGAPLVTPPSIETHPQSLLVQLGASASFTVSASGTPPLLYEWFFNGSAIVGATNDNFTILQTRYANAGTYSVRVANAAGSVTSSNATLTVDGPPVISMQPASQIVGPGATVNFLVGANGTLPLAYQWSRGGIEIDGATNTTLRLSGVTTNDAGSYTVRIQNTFGSTTSRPATLVLDMPPDYSGLSEILVEAVIHGRSQLVLSNESVHWNHETNLIPGYSSLLGKPVFPTTLDTYDWHPTWPLQPNVAQESYPLTASVGSIDFTGEIIEGRGSLTFARQGDSFVVTFDDTGSEGEALYKARLVRAFPSIVTQPTNIVALGGGNAAFSVVAAGSTPLSYQWRKNGFDLPSKTNSTLTLTGVVTSDAGNYSVVVANSIGAVSSQAATLTVAVPPAIVSQPVAQVAALGSPAALSVAATGSAPLVYRWQRYGTNISDGGGLTGTTTNNLAFAGVEPKHEGLYQVVITNNYGSVTSSSAGLTVQLPVWVSTFAGSGVSNLIDGYAMNAAFIAPDSGRMGLDGALYTSDIHALRRIAADGVVSTWAGGYAAGFTNGSGTSALFNTPLAALPLPSGDVLVADALNQMIRQVSPDASHTVSTLAGTGTVGWLDGPCYTARLNFPNDLVVDGAGNVFFTEFTGQRLRKISPACAVSTLAGSGTSGWVDGFGTNASFQSPGGLDIDTAGNLYVTDYGGHRIRKVTTGGVVTTVAGSGTPGLIDGLGTNASFNIPNGIAVGPDGSLYVCESGNHAIRRITPWGGVVTVVGLGSPGNADGDSSVARFNTPGGLVFASDGNLLVMDGGNRRIRKVAFFDGTLKLAQTPASRSVVAGDPTTFSVVALSWGAKSYRWLKDGTTVPGATNSTLILTNTTAADSGFYAVAVSEGATTLTSSPPARLEVLFPPRLTSEPVSLTAVVGDTVSFTVAAEGTPPLSYQWRYNGLAMPGKTSPQLTLSDVQLTNAGQYSVTVSNLVSVVTSTNAQLTVTSPTYLTAQDVTVTDLEAVTLPLAMTAAGVENALGFSLVFDPSKLRFSSAVLGSGGGGAALILNTNQAPSGRVGVGIALGAGATFPAGTMELLRATFSVTPPTSGSPTLQTVSFGDVPTPRQVVDAFAIPRLAFYTGAVVTIPPASFEADVAPRPGGDRTLSIADWVQVGRFVAVLDIPTAGVEFQRADCAPRVARGDGQLGVTDWVQAGRYAVGLDPLTLAAGPDTAGPGPLLAVRQSEPATQDSGGVRTVRVLPASAYAGSAGSVVVELEAQGDENALGFSLSYDPAMLSYTSAAIGQGATGATLNINTNSASSGKLGLAISKPIGSSFAAGNQELVALTFQVSAEASESAVLSFGNTPVRLETSDALANALPTSYEPGLLSIAPPLVSLAISAAGQHVTVSWYVTGTGPTNLVLQQNISDSLSPTLWSNLPPEWVMSTNGHYTVTLTNTGSYSYFRLFRPSLTTLVP